jgi:IS30 family transposase
LRQQHRLAKLDKESVLRTFVIDRLREGWSPQQIDGRFRLSAKRCVISYETIYAYIYSPSGKAQKLYTSLQKRRRYRYPRIKRRRQKTAIEAEKIRIDQRTETINQRETFGHWEGDLVIFRIS